MRCMASVFSPPTLSLKILSRLFSWCLTLLSNQKLASTQTIGSAFLEIVRQVQNSKYEHDLLKIIDCFFDGYGFVNSDHVNFFLKKILIIHLFSLICLGNYQKLPKKITVVKKLAKSFSNMKERCNISFDFQEVAKNISFFLTSCKKCFNFFNKMRKVFQIF